MTLPILSACSTSTSAISDTLRLLTSSGPRADESQLQPGFTYLRVEHSARVVLMALGYTEPHDQGAIEVWYSGEGEVIRLQKGRIVGTAGLKPDWTAVRTPALPDWHDLRQPFRYSRSRDEMPGYRMNIDDQIVLRPIPAPEKTFIKGDPFVQLTWFEESSVGPGDLPPARFAVELAAPRDYPVYSEQCLSRDVCLSLQRWPPATVAGR